MLLLCRSRKRKGEWYHVVLSIYILSATLRAFFFTMEGEMKVWRLIF
jgi:hypothetical protein